MSGSSNTKSDNEKMQFADEVLTKATTAAEIKLRNIPTFDTLNAANMIMVKRAIHKELREIHCCLAGTNEYNWAFVMITVADWALLVTAGEVLAITKPKHPGAATPAMNNYAAIHKYKTKLELFDQ